MALFVLVRVNLFFFLSRFLNTGNGHTVTIMSMGNGVNGQVPEEWSSVEKDTDKSAPVPLNPAGVRMGKKIRVLFICTANAARSQMAEGLLRAKYGNKYEVFSAGTRQSKVSTRAITVMQEIGIDISHHHSKTLAEYKNEMFDLAITLCDNAHAACPVVPGAARTIHQPFLDPHLVPGTEDESLDVYRSVRDAMGKWIDTTFG